MAFTTRRTRSTNLGPPRCTGAGLAAALALALTLAPLILAPLILAGCSPYKAPVLDMTGVAPLEESPEGFVVTLTLSARNENEVPLPLRQVEYALDLGPAGPEGWTGSFRGTRSAEATLRAGGAQTIVLPAAIPLGPGERVPEGPVPYRLRADITYITPGALADVLFDTGVRRPSVSFDREGVIDFGAAPATEAAPEAEPRASLAR